MPFYSDFHGRIVDAGLDVLLQAWRTYLFSLFFFLAPLFFSVVLGVLVPLLTSNPLGGIFLVIVLSLNVLLIPTMALTGGMMVSDTVRNKTDSWECISWLGSNGPRVFGIGIVLLVFPLIVLAIGITSNLTTSPLFSVLEGVSQSVDLLLGLPLAGLLIVVGVALNFLLTVWGYALTVTVPARYFATGTTVFGTVKEEFKSILNRIGDYILWVLVMNLGVGILSLIQPLGGFIPALVLFHWLYVIAFLAEYQRLSDSET